MAFPVRSYEREARRTAERITFTGGHRRGNMPYRKTAYLVYGLTLEGIRRLGFEALRERT